MLTLGALEVVGSHGQVSETEEDEHETKDLGESHFEEFLVV